MGCRGGGRCVHAGPASGKLGDFNHFYGLRKCPAATFVKR
ncbi:Hypothetical protein EPM1_0011 [Stenotrophomonas maltophilia EPM1]|nr:Hypothetical protein EPM1_0011 [Stenotrophomonas maltophilia EPM1]